GAHWIDCSPYSVPRVYRERVAARRDSSERKLPTRQSRRGVLLFAVCGNQLDRGLANWISSSFAQHATQRRQRSRVQRRNGQKYKKEKEGTRHFTEPEGHRETLYAGLFCARYGSGPGRYRGCADVGIELYSFVVSLRKSNEKACFALPSNEFARPRLIDPLVRLRDCGGRFFLLASSTASGEENSEDDGNQWPYARRQLLLAARKEESRSKSLSRSRERLHRCGDEAHRSFTKKAVRRNAEPHQGNGRRGAL